MIVLVNFSVHRRKPGLTTELRLLLEWYIYSPYLFCRLQHSLPIILGVF